MPIKTARLDDLDKPIFRIFPIWFFENTLRAKHLILRSPSAWDDPYEDMCANAQIIDQRTSPWKHDILESTLPRTWAQCWSYESYSDTLLRAYSRVNLDKSTNRNLDPRHEGVRVKTTPELLLKALGAFEEKRPTVHIYLGRVIYLDADQIGGRIAAFVKQFGITGIGKPDVRAEALFLKRNYFRHEDEVRLLCVDINNQTVTDDLMIPIEPNELFLEVEFDPRLISFENRERQEQAKNLGYNGKFIERGLYTKTLFDIVIPQEKGGP